jgi:hypothetical protein
VADGDQREVRKGKLEVRRAACGGMEDHRNQRMDNWIIWGNRAVGAAEERREACRTVAPMRCGKIVIECYVRCSGGRKKKRHEKKEARKGGRKRGRRETTVIRSRKGKSLRGHHEERKRRDEG